MQVPNLNIPLYQNWKPGDPTWEMACTRLDFLVAGEQDGAHGRKHDLNGDFRVLSFAESWKSAISQVVLKLGLKLKRPNRLWTRVDCILIIQGGTSSVFQCTAAHPTSVKNNIKKIFVNDFHNFHPPFKPWNPLCILATFLRSAHLVPRSPNENTCTCMWCLSCFQWDSKQKRSTEVMIAELNTSIVPWSSIYILYISSHGAATGDHVDRCHGCHDQAPTDLTLVNDIHPALSAQGLKCAVQSAKRYQLEDTTWPIGCLQKLKQRVFQVCPLAKWLSSHRFSWHWVGTGWIKVGQSTMDFLRVKTWTPWHHGDMMAKSLLLEPSPQCHFLLKLIHKYSLMIECWGTQRMKVHWMSSGRNPCAGSSISRSWRSW